jgi:hypothetical protein
MLSWQTLNENIDIQQLRLCPLRCVTFLRKLVDSAGFVSPVSVEVAALATESPRSQVDQGCFIAVASFVRASRMR